MLRSTQSFSSYKGYEIVIRAATFGGLGYKIFKYAEIPTFMGNPKKLYLRERVWSFILPDEALQHAHKYIDEFGYQLDNKYYQMNAIYSEKQTRLYNP